MTPIRIRSGRGLGDSIYLRPLVEQFRADGHPVTVLTDYPGIFEGTGASTEKFNRFQVNCLAHYTMNKGNPNTNQWQDICGSAGLIVPLETKWRKPQGLATIVREMAGPDRPVVLVHGGRIPMGRTDGFGAEIMPLQAAFETIIADLRGYLNCFTVRLGAGGDAYPLDCNLDLNDKTTEQDLLDLASGCDAVLGQCSWAIPLAEIFDKPLLVVWARAGLESKEEFVRQITPSKVLSKKSSRAVFDDAPITELLAAGRELIGAATNGKA